MRKLSFLLVFTLDSMEKWGIRVKGEELKAYGEALAGRIQELEKQIYEQAGEEFNINSPKQLGVILFEKLGIPGGKKTKTGYSTAAEILEKLAPEQPVVNDILEYRQLTKLKSTYADGLGNVIEKDGRIHSTFNQTITATGRISSTEPNLPEHPCADGTWKADSEGVCTGRRLCIFRCGLFSDRASCISAHVRR